MYVTLYTPAVDFSVNKNPSELLIATLKATNGASVVDGDNLNTGKDLSWSIQSQTNSSGISGSYFTTSVSNTNLISTCELRNNQVDTITPDAYTVVLRVTDAGGAVYEITITVNMGVQILPGQVTNTLINFAVEEGGGTSPDSEYVTFIVVTESVISSQNGLYMYSQDWGNLGVGGGLVTIDYTNAVNLQVECPNSNTFWAFSTDTSLSGKNEMADDFVMCYHPNVVTINSVYEESVDTTNNTFVII
jgi:hypothetical protein